MMRVVAGITAFTGLEFAGSMSAWFTCSGQCRKLHGALALLCTNVFLAYCHGVRRLEQSRQFVMPSDAETVHLCMQVIVRTPSGRLQIITSLLGKHNVYNILAAVATGIALKVLTAPGRAAAPANERLLAETSPFFRVRKGLQNCQSCRGVHHACSSVKGAVFSLYLLRPAPLRHTGPLEEHCGGY
jgi:hypothetical protein